MMVIRLMNSPAGRAAPGLAAGTPPAGGHRMLSGFGCAAAGVARGHPDADQAARLRGSRAPDPYSPTPEQGDLCWM